VCGGGVGDGVRTYGWVVPGTLLPADPAPAAGAGAVPVTATAATVGVAGPLATGGLGHAEATKHLGSDPRRVGVGGDTTGPRRWDASTPPHDSGLPLTSKYFRSTATCAAI
jgi:hypothetical protein